MTRNPNVVFRSGNSDPRTIGGHALVEPYSGDLDYLQDEARRIELLLRLRRLEDRIENQVYGDPDRDGPDDEVDGAFLPIDEGTDDDPVRTSGSNGGRPTAGSSASSSGSQSAVLRYVERCRTLLSADIHGRNGDAHGLDAVQRALAVVHELDRDFGQIQKLLSAAIETRKDGKSLGKCGQGHRNRASRSQAAGQQPGKGAHRLEALGKELRSTWARIAARRLATRAAGRALALDRLAETCGLSEVERDILLALAAPLLVPRLRKLYGKLMDSWREPEVGGIIALLAPTVPQSVAFRRYFTASAPLHRHNLIGLNGNDPVSEGDFLSCGVELPRRVFGLLLGEHALDESLLGFTHVLRPDVPLDHVVLPARVKEKVLTLVHGHPRFLAALREWRMDKVVPYGRGVFLLFSGPPGTGKTLLAHALATHLGKPLLKVDLHRLHDVTRSTETAVRDIFREAVLMDAIIFFDECEIMFADRRYGNSAMTVLLTEMEQFEGIAILSTNMPLVLDEAVDRRIRLKVDFPTPSVELREKIWRVHLPDTVPLADDVDIRDLAERFDLPGGYIKNAVLTAVQHALARSPESPRITQADLKEAGRQQVRDRLAGKVERRVPRIPLARLILNPPVAEQVQAALWAARHQHDVFERWGLERTVARGRAVTLLLAGPPGTGKSAVAEALAYELGRPLHVVNLAGMLSMWMGETEKNLVSVFREAQEEQAVLVFEEADVLFASREDSGIHARREVSVLLEEMERFEGVLAATTNLPETIDPAFERRFRYRLDFGPPNAETRLAIWKSHLPAELPLAEDVDIEIIAERYALTGGQIRNALVLAATEAARQGRDRVGMADMEGACERAGEPSPGRTKVGFSHEP